MATDGGREKRELHDLVEKLPPDQAPAALRYLHFLCADPILLSLLDATADDEAYTDRQRAEDADAAAAIARGEGIAHEEILREFSS
jgi:hypothetical protein